MKKLVLCLTLLAPMFVFAQDAHLVLDAGVVVDAGNVVSLSPVIADPTPLVKVVFQAVAKGDWFAAAAALLVLVVAFLRKYGQWLHEKIPDNNPADKVLWFLLETKPGGWALNFLTTVAGGTGTAILAGENITWALVKPIVLVSITGASLWELIKDVGEYVQGVKDANAKQVSAEPKLDTLPAPAPVAPPAVNPPAVIIPPAP